MTGLVLEVLEMERFVERSAGLPHLPKELEPAPSQAAESGNVTLAKRPAVLIIGLRPWALVAAAIAPLVHGGAQACRSFTRCI